ncbi:MAG TPA: F0F1 ATP synthase subunit epsilon [bacterium]|nr:F0F1 ATP synthase subunit epsilon [bacterium]
MQLRLLLPDGVLLDAPADKIIAEAGDGCFCLLPQHIDFVTALVPGLLAYTPPNEAPELLAVDAGTLVKQGTTVRVTVQRAVRTTVPGQLARTVANEFRVLALAEREARAAAARLDTDLMRRFIALRTAAGLAAGGELW